MPLRADVGKGGDASGSFGKAVGAATHWKLLGSSVRPLLPICLHIIQAYDDICFRFWHSQRRAPVSLVSLGLETGAKHQLRIHLSKVLNGEETPPPHRITCECSTRCVSTAPVLGDPLYSSNHELCYLPGVGVQRGLYLHASQVSFHVSSSLPSPNPYLHSITTKTFIPVPPPNFHRPRPHQLTRHHRSSCSSAHRTLISHRATASRDPTNASKLE